MNCRLLLCFMVLATDLFAQESTELLSIKWDVPWHDNPIDTNVNISFLDDTFSNGIKHIEYWRNYNIADSLHLKHTADSQSETLMNQQISISIHKAPFDSASFFTDRRNHQQVKPHAYPGFFLRA